MNKKLLLAVLAVAVTLTSACTKQEVSKRILDVPMGQTSVEQQVKQWAKDTNPCPRCAMP